MMICKVLVITVFCVLTVAFPSLDIDSINEELQDSIFDILNSTSDFQLASYEPSTSPPEDSTYQESNTDFMQTTYSKSIQISELSNGAETVSSSFLEEVTETSESTVEFPLAETTTFSSTS
ncbi:kidney androgen regulated protein [Rattus norvegicus]|uniref:Kidney androgen-regulated protein n=2 Tax=Rattus norvegicus TaxID=10116 RepID=ANRE_RAT|nr:kidney androgen-regulated protein precursor [Rattus norvegicus]Q62781.1 RecName: Full=Kidney androgen-regulated protein; Short=ARP; Short=KAP; Flags: Precursor [Rattus norvegicus]AAA67078.1 KAP [Rattus norvegicus]EDM01663.1 kidney androgen regulated protein [Rattus norvegicus]|eukprot:NP_434689.1 kidney androgen-regulated protein precursor [Rattus norvegicus]